MIAAGCIAEGCPDLDVQAEPGAQTAGLAGLWRRRRHELPPAPVGYQANVVSGPSMTGSEMVKVTSFPVLRSISCRPAKPGPSGAP